MMIIKAKENTPNKNTSNSNSERGSDDLFNISFTSITRTPAAARTTPKAEFIFSP